MTKVGMVIGQSNDFLTRAYDWTPASTVRFWNQQQGVDTSVGTAFDPIPTTLIRNSWAFGDRLATKYPGEDIRLIQFSQGSMDIGHFNWGNAYLFSGIVNDAGPYPDGQFRMNNAAIGSVTELYISPNDVTGSNKGGALNGLLITRKITIVGGISGATKEFTIISTGVNNSTHWTVGVNSASETGVMLAGEPIRFAISPNFAAQYDTVMTAALAETDRTTIDWIQFRFGESDMNFSTIDRFTDEFEEMIDRIKSHSWCPNDVKIIIYGVNDSRRNGQVSGRKMNDALARIAANDLTNRRFIDLARFTANGDWQDGTNIHMTAAGYFKSGQIAIQRVIPFLTTSSVVKVRNAANTGFDARELKVRNTANSGYVSGQLKFRNPDNTGWINAGGGQVRPLSLTVNTGWTDIVDFTGDPRRRTLSNGFSNGLWLDMPLNLWRDENHDMWGTLGTWITWRMRVNGNVLIPGALVTSPNDHVWESESLANFNSYGNHGWIYAPYRDGSKMYAVAHMEWYQTRQIVDGWPGYNGYSLRNRRWVTSNTPLKSLNNGLTWASPTPDEPASFLNHLRRSFMRVENWLVQSRDTLYGYRHPSIPRKEGDYYYMFSDTVMLPGGTDLVDSGLILIRWTDWEDLTTVEYWGGPGVGWIPRDDTDVIGNLGPVHPHLFFKATGLNPYVDSPKNNRLAQTLVWHWPTEQWVIVGMSGTTVGALSFAQSKTLANPQFEENGIKGISGSFPAGVVAGNYVGSNYFRIIDFGSSDPNFTDVGNNLTLIRCTGYAKVQTQQISLSEIV